MTMDVVVVVAAVAFVPGDKVGDLRWPTFLREYSC